MGIFSTIVNMFSGKSNNVSQDQNAQASHTDSGQSGPLQPEQGGRKVIPVIRFGRIENQVDTTRLSLYANVENQSEVAIFIDWVNILGAKRQIDIQLRPGEARQLLIYTGPRLASRPDGLVEMQYRTADSGDYFMNYHEIRSQQEKDGSFRVTEMLQRGPVKDLR